MPSAVLGMPHGQPRFIPSEGPLSPARSSVEGPLAEKPLEGTTA